MLHGCLVTFQPHSTILTAIDGWTTLTENEAIDNYLHEYYNGTDSNPSESYWFLQKKYSALYLKPFSLKHVPLEYIENKKGYAWKPVGLPSFISLNFCRSHMMK